jgi:hypothetical protein
VAVETDPEQLGGLALVPVGPRPQVVHGGQAAAVAGHHRADLDVVTVAGRVDVEHHRDAGRLLVHAAEEFEEVAVEVAVLADELGHAAVVVRRHGHGQQPVADLRFEGVAELGDQVVGEGGGVH